MENGLKNPRKNNVVEDFSLNEFLSYKRTQILILAFARRDTTKLVPFVFGCTDAWVTTQ